MQDVLAVALEAAGAIRHYTLALRGSDGSAKIGLARLCDFLSLAPPADVNVRTLQNLHCLHSAVYSCLQDSLSERNPSGEERSGAYGNDVIANLHVGDSLANALYNATAFVAKDDGEGSLGILSRKGVGILKFRMASTPVRGHAAKDTNCVAETRV